MAAKLGNGGPPTQLLHAVCAGVAAVVLLALPAAAHAAPAWSGARSLAELNPPGMAAVACPSATECVAVEGPPLPQAPRTDEVNYNPAAPGGWSAYTVDRGSSATAVACNSSTSCTAVGSSGRAVTFNPRAPAGATAYTVDPGHTLRAVACPSAHQCTAVDGVGGEVTFKPKAVRAVTPTRVDRSALSGVACPTTAVCVAADAGGKLVEGAPGKPWSVVSLSGADPPLVVACGSSSACVALDGDGHEFAGRP